MLTRARTARLGAAGRRVALGARVGVNRAVGALAQVGAVDALVGTLSLVGTFSLVGTLALVGTCSLVGTLALVVATPAARAAERNRAPIARLEVSATEVEVGEAIHFDATRSVDPDAGPEPLEFDWAFGDGRRASEARVDHRYAEPGVYDVELRVEDGAWTGIATTTVSVRAQLHAGRPARSSGLALTPDGSTLYVVNTDAGSVSVLDTRSLTVSAEIPVCAAPQRAALDATATRLFVSCGDADQLAVVTTGGQRVVARLPVGHRPFGVAVAPRSGRVVVANQGDDSLSILEPAFIAARLDETGRGAPHGQGARPGARIAEPEARNMPVGDGPRSVAIDAAGDFAYVTHFLSRGPFGVVTRVHLDSGSTTRILLGYDHSPDTPSSGGGRPNLLEAIALDGAGGRVWVGGQKSNVDVGLIASGAPLVATNRIRALLAPIDVASGRETPGARLDANNADHVSAIEILPGDRYVALAHRGSGRISIYDLLRVAAQPAEPNADGEALPFAARFDVGHTPTALAFDAATHRLYVSNALSRSVSVIDLRDPTQPRGLAEVRVSDEPLAPAVALGKRLFNRSRSPEHSADNYIACWSCHPDGGMDGLTWDLTQYGEGLRNTIDLRGRGGLADGPLHWTGNFDEVQDLEIDIVRAFGGTGLAADGAPPHPPLGAARNGGRSEALDALAAYVSSLDTPPPSPYRGADGGLTASAREGERLFHSEALGCTTCHPAPRFTDSAFEGAERTPRLHDVGTLHPGSGRRLGEPLHGLDTPSLLGLWDTAPYLHDGSARSLDHVFGLENPDDRHGTTSQLREVQRGQLVQYLLQLDARSRIEPR